MKVLGGLSRLLSRLTGGKPGQTLCGRIAARYGHDCLFCCVVGRVLNDTNHCWDEMIKDIKRGDN